MSTKREQANEQQLETVEHKTLAEALSAFQREAPTFTKNKTATISSQRGTYSYKYADLGEILPKVNPLMAKHGLAWTAELGFQDGDLVLSYSLLHVSGEHRDAMVPLGVPKGARPQEIGSAITYMSRYAIKAQLNLATDEDDDGQAAQDASRPRPQQQAQDASRPRPHPQPQTTPAQQTEFAASAKQRSLIYARAKELQASALANAILEATFSERRDWVSEDAALAWVNRSMERLPARFVAPLLAIVQREVEALPSVQSDAEPEPEEPEPTIPMEMDAAS